MSECLHEDVLRAAQLFTIQRTIWAAPLMGPARLTADGPDLASEAGAGWPGRRRRLRLRAPTAAVVRTVETPLGGVVYYSAGLASLTASAVAAALPTSTVLWRVARDLLDAAGGLFALYLAVILALLLLGSLDRHLGRGSST